MQLNPSDSAPSYENLKNKENMQLNQQSISKNASLRDSSPAYESIYSDDKIL